MIALALVLALLVVLAVRATVLEVRRDRAARAPRSRFGDPDFGPAARHGSWH